MIAVLGQQSFSGERVRALRRRARCAARMPCHLPTGWFKSPVDPHDVLAVFRSLRLKPGFVLRAYQLRQGGNGNGFVYAAPAEAPFPEPDACERRAGHFLDPPAPPGALGDVMEAIEGDGTPWSYIEAFVFAREMAEFGALWHGCDWGTHTILGANPFDGGYAPVMMTTDAEGLAVD